MECVVINVFGVGNKPHQFDMATAGADWCKISSRGKKVASMSLFLAKIEKQLFLFYFFNQNKQSILFYSPTIGGLNVRCSSNTSSGYLWFATLSTAIFFERTWLEDWGSMICSKTSACSRSGGGLIYKMEKMSTKWTRLSWWFWGQCSFLWEPAQS